MCNNIYIIVVNLRHNSNSVLVHGSGQAQDKLLLVSKYYYILDGHLKNLWVCSIYPNNTTSPFCITLKNVLQYYYLNDYVSLYLYRFPKYQISLCSYIVNHCLMWCLLSVDAY